MESSSSSPIPICGERSSTKKTRLRDMSDEELLQKLDEALDGEEISKETLQKLREYCAELEDSQGFEINTWPGSFFGVTSIIPAQLSKEDKPEAYSEYESLAKFAMDEYNKNNQAEFVFEELVRANVHAQIYTRYYLTFTAHDGRVEDATPVTFRAVVVVYMGPGDTDMRLDSCRPKDPS